MSVTTDPRSSHFREWLYRNFTGCSFATAFAADPRLAFNILEETFDATAAHGVDRFLDETVTTRHVAVLLGPRVRTVAGIVRLLAALKTTGRWRVVVRNHGAADRQGSVIVDVAWKTSTNEHTSVMGFAPLGCMPVTRRSPYVALVLWAGDHANEWTDREPDLGIIGCPHDMNEPKYRSQWTATNRQVKQLLELPPEDAVELRRVTFALPANTRGVDALR